MTAVFFTAAWLAAATPWGARGGTADNPETVPDASKEYTSPTNGLGSWIWTDKTYDQQTCQLWKTFVIPASTTVTNARLMMTADNDFTVFLDGRELGRGDEWRELFVFDLTEMLTPGTHVLAVKAFNTFDAAGMLLGLQAALADGRTVEVKSDSSWKIVPNETQSWETMTNMEAGWPDATIIAPLGNKPWWARPHISPTSGLGSWIWTDKTFDQQTCQLWKAFIIPDSSPIAKARLVMTVDNEFTVLLDGRELGRGAEWRELFVFDLTQILTPGPHVLAVKAFNSAEAAGMLLGLQVELADGRTIEVKSDASWKIVPNETRRWEKMTRAQSGWPDATIIAPLGRKPWWASPQGVNLMPPPERIKVYFWQTGWFQITLLSVCFVVIGLSFRLMAHLAFHQGENWLLQRERARIARDIHDDIGPRMTRLVIHGEEAQNDVPGDAERNQHLVQICEEARGLLATMDEILWAVNPRRDTLHDFAVYVCNYAQEFLASAEIQCLFAVDQEMPAVALNLPLRHSLLMAIKEALNNAVKHSAATELHLQIQRQGQRLVVAVQDNGRGFDPALTKPERNGLNNMAQRISDLGGTYLLTSQPGKGCRVEFIVPLAPPRRYTWEWLWNTRKLPAQPRT